MIGAAMIHAATGAHAHAANLLGGVLIFVCLAAYVGLFTLVLVKITDARLAKEAESDAA